MPWGFWYGLALTAVSGLATAGFMVFIDRGHTIVGAAASAAQRDNAGTPGPPPRTVTAGD